MRMPNLPWLLRWRWELALASCIAVSVGVLVMSETGHHRLTAGYDTALRSMWATERLGDLRATLVDAETGKRGFLITGEEGYLKPYHDAAQRVGDLLQPLREHYAQDTAPKAFASIGKIVELTGAKLGEMEQTIGLARTGRTDLARALVESDFGKHTMDTLRESIRVLQVEERERTAAAISEWRGNLMLSRLGIATIAALNIVLLVCIVRWLKQDWQRARAREQELDRQVKERTDELASLSSYLQEVSETEKTRLARELHDELGAILTATRMDLIWVKGRLAREQTALSEKLQRALGNLDQGITLKRRIIEDLRPSILSNFGLTTAARELAQQAAEQAEWKLKLELPEDDLDLEDEVEIALFRVLQEALNNATKYARAKHVRVSLQCVSDTPRHCKLEIEDDGVGFRRRDVRPQAHGLAGMRQRIEPRGGSLLIRSELGKGTLVRAIVPMDEPRAAATGMYSPSSR